MLQLTCISQETHNLLKALSAKDELCDFALAGGTALALYLGHRVSVDLDFFTTNCFDPNALFDSLKGAFDIRSCSTAENSLSFFVKTGEETVKVDMLRHNYPYLEPLSVGDNLRLFSIEDIAAMKLNAVANRGAKKDFYDIHALLRTFTLNELLGFFKRKYEPMNIFSVVKSLVYFDDAEREPDPISVIEKDWDTVKEELKVTLQRGSNLYS